MSSSETPFVLSEIHQSAINWSLASDARLLLLLEDFSKGLFTSVQDAGDKLKHLGEHSETANAKLANVCNSFSALCSSQFIENRVDENVEAKKVQNETTDKAPEENVMEKCTEALRIGLATLDMQFQRVDIAPTSPGANAELPKSSIFVPINPYADRRLPVLIGSMPFFADDYCGLYNPNEDQAIPGEVSQPSKQEEAEASASPPPPPSPPQPPQAANVMATIDNTSVHSSESAVSAKQLHDQEPVSAPMHPGLGGVHSELLGKFNQFSAVDDISDEDDEGDLFASKPAAQPKLVIPRTDQQSLFEDESAKDSENEQPETVPAAHSTEKKVPGSTKAPSFLAPAPANNLFDAGDEDDDLDDLFSASMRSNKSKTTAKPAFSSTPQETNKMTNEATSNILFGDDDDGDDDNQNEKASDVGSYRTELHDDAASDLIKPSRSDSTVSGRKLPTGAVSLFGASGKADPLASALRSRLNIGGNAPNLDTAGQTAPKEDKQLPPPKPVSVVSEPKEPTPPKPAAQLAPEKIEPEPVEPKLVLPPASNMPKSNLFDNDSDDDDFFGGGKQPTKLPAKAAVSKPVLASGSLFDDADDDDDDLFGKPKTSKPVENRVAPEPVSQKLPELVSEASSPKSIATKLPAAFKPKIAAASLFDDDNSDDDDLFGSSSSAKPSKTTGTVAPSAVAKKDSVNKPKPQASSLFDDSPSKTDADDFLFSSSAPREETTQTAPIAPKETKKEAFQTAPVLSKIEETEAEKPIKLSEPRKEAESGEKTTSSPAKPSSSISAIKAQINPLALLPGARPTTTKSTAVDVTAETSEKRAQPSISKQKLTAASKVAEDSSVLNFDETSEKRTLVSSGSGRVTGPRRARPSRWNKTQEGFKQTQPSAEPKVQPQTIKSDDSLAAPGRLAHAPVTTSPKLQQASLFDDDDTDNIFRVKPKTTDNKLVDSKQEQPAPALFDDADDDIFGSVSSPVTAPPKMLPPEPTKASPKIEKTVPQNPLADDDVDVDDIFA